MTVGGRLILVVDDDVEIRKALEEILGLEGYEVAGAQDGRDALDQLDAGLEPCVILLDLMMPRMTGEEFLEARAVHARSKAPVLIMSAHRKVDPAAAGADAFLEKPFLLEQLLELVAKLCRKAYSPGGPDGSGAA